MIARVKGSFRVIVVPLPRTEAISTVPPKDSMLLVTTSMPTPLPDTLDIDFAVEKPGVSMSSKRSFSLIAASGLMSPFSMALDLMASVSRPAPSSLTEMSTFAPECSAVSLMVPSAGLPAAFLASGDSIP
ncbi:MAG: hypothetical protein BWZ01_02710 [Deltaproteobacteria bacterium ADurb.BinA179]|nr:MAG: hypothetical protein BWZ01_02710 [Deltaproteobacteria bacterium ADurb.BinA179]